MMRILCVRCVLVSTAMRGPWQSGVNYRGYCLKSCRSKKRQPHMGQFKMFH